MGVIGIFLCELLLILKMMMGLRVMLGQVAHVIKLLIKLFLLNMGPLLVEVIDNRWRLKGWSMGLAFESLILEG